MQYGYFKGLANITCEAEAEPAATFTWYRNNQPLDSKVYQVHNSLHKSVLQVIPTFSHQFISFKLLNFYNFLDYD